MRITFEIDTKVIGDNYLRLIEEADEAQQRLILEVADISPVLSKYLVEFQCKCLSSNPYNPSIEYHVPVYIPGAMGRAIYQVKRQGETFTIPTADEIIAAFLRRHPETGEEVEFPDSRIGKQFAWGFNACLKAQAERHTAMMEIRRLGIFETE